MQKNFTIKMAVLLHRQDLLVAILETKPVMLASHVITDADVKAVVDAIPRPKVSWGDIRTIKKEMESLMDMGDVLRNHAIEIEFSKEICQNIRSVREKSIELWQYFAYGTLLEYLGWQLDQNVGYLPELLSTIQYVLERLEMTPDTHLSDLLRCSFYYSYQMYLRETHYTKIGETKTTLIQFFLSHPHIDIAFYNILLTIIRKLPCDDGVLSYDLKEYLGFMITLQESDVKFEEAMLGEVIQCILPSVMQLDPCALTALSAFSWALPDDALEIYIAQVANFLYEMVTEAKRVTDVNLPEVDDPEADDVPTDSVHLTIFDVEDDMKSLDFDNGVTFPVNLPLLSLVPEEVHDAIISIQNMFRETPKAVVFFAKAFCDKTRRSIDGIATLLGVLQGIPNGGECMEYLMDSILYDTQFTMFVEGPYQVVGSTLRNYALEIMGSGDSSVLAKFIDRMKVRPLVLAEHCYRMVQTQMYYNLDEKGRYNVAYELLKVVGFYKGTKLVLERVETAQTSVLVLLSHMFSVKEFSSEFFRDPYFASVFTSFLYGDALRAFAIRIIQQHFRTIDKPDEELPPLLANVLTVAMDQLPNEKVMVLVIDVLVALNDLLRVKCNMPFSLVVIKTTLPELLVLLPKADKGSSSYVRRILLESMEFFTLTSNLESSKATAVSAFKQSLRKIYGYDIPEEYYQKLVQLMAGRNLSSLQPVFSVKEPKFVTLFIDVYHKSERLKEVLKFVHSLCNFSPDNALACHKGKADLYILNMIKTQELSSEMVQECMGILAAVACLVSSPGVVESFISLFHCVEDRVSANHSLYLQTMASIISKCGSRPYAHFPLLSDGMKSKTHVSSKEVSRGFTFMCWLRINQFGSQYSPHIFTIKDDNRQFISMKMKSGSFIVTMRSRKSMSTGIGEVVSHPDDWFLMTFSIKFIIDLCDPSKSPRGLSKAMLSINGRLLAEMHFPKFLFTTQNLSLQIGGTTPDSIDTVDCVRMSSWALFPTLEADAIAMIQQNGPRLSMHQNSIAVSLAYPVRDHDKIAIKTLVGSPYETEGECMSIWRNLADTLVETCGVELLLPLFSQIHLTDVALVVELLCTTIMNNEQAQQSLVDCKGASIIAAILMNIKEEYMNHTLYLKFFSLFKSVHNPDLQTDIFHKILFSGELLKKCDEDSQLFIAKHWNRTLFPMYLSLNLRAPSFSDLLAMINLYFFYTKSYDDQYNNDKPGDISAMRSNILQCACLLPIVPADVPNIVTHFINSVDDRDMLDVFMALQILAKRNSLSGVKREFAQFEIENIISMVKLLNPTISTAVIQTMFCLIECDVIVHLTKVDVVDIILHQMSIARCTSEVFQALKNELSDETLLPLMMWMAFTLKEDSYFTTLVPNPAYCGHFAWAFWPLAIAMKSALGIQRIIVEFLCKCDLNQIGVLLTTSYAVGDILEVDPSQTQRMILCTACRLILDGTYKCDIDPIYDMIYRFVFFQSHTHIDMLHIVDMYNDGLIRAKRASVTASLIRPRQTSRISSHRASLNPDISRHIQMHSSQSRDRPTKIESRRTDLLPGTIYHYLERIDSTKPALAFGMHIDPDGNWADAELVNLFLKIYHRNPSPVYANIALVLLGFIYRVEGDKEWRNFANDITAGANNMDGFLKYEKLRHLNTGSDKYGPFAKSTLMLGDILTPVLATRLWKEELSFRTRIQAFAEMIRARTSSINNMLSIGTEFVHIYSETKKSENYENQIIWEMFWHKITRPKAPWNESEELISTVHRRTILCNNFCPLKFKCELNQNPESYDVRNMAAEEREKRKMRLIIPYDDTIEPNATLMSTMKITEVELHVEQDKCIIKSPHKLKEFAASDIASQIVYTRNVERPPCMLIVTKDRKPVFLMCPDSMINAMIESRMQWNESWTEMWADRRMSSFEFLMKLNMYAGRNFSNMSYYPVFPSLTRNFGPPRPPNGNVIMHHLHVIKPFSDLGFGAATESDQHDWIPELYSDSRIIPFIHAYQHRKTLESDELSNSLRSWIGKLWPEFAPLPPRRRYVDIPPIITSFATGLGKIQSAVITIGDPYYEICMIAETKILFANAAGQIQQKTVKNLPPGPLIATKAWGHLFISTRKSYELEMRNKKKIMKKIQQTEKIAAICQSQNYLAVAMSDAVVKLFDSDLNEKLITTYLCGVTCAAVNEEFDALAIGSKNGSVLICSIRKRCVESAITLEDREVRDVKITASWGLVVILTSDKLDIKYTVHVYTLYGALVEETVIARHITAMCTFSSHSDTDYVVLGNVNGVIHICDAVHPTRTQIIHRTSHPPIAIEYDAVSNRIFIVTKDGEVTVIEKEWL